VRKCVHPAGFSTDALAERYGSSQSSPPGGGGTRQSVFRRLIVMSAPTPSWDAQESRDQKDWRQSINPVFERSPSVSKSGAFCEGNVSTTQACRAIGLHNGNTVAAAAYCMRLDGAPKHHWRKGIACTTLRSSSFHPALPTPSGTRSFTALCFTSP
jgi:hypothetical protein